jgi:hypothetical protein
MLGFAKSIVDNLDEDKIREDFERMKTQKAQRYAEQENRDAGVEEMVGEEDCDPVGRSSRAKDAFRRAQS